jgi:mono/diheme cytochrome c family protein
MKVLKGVVFLCLVLGLSFTAAFAADDGAAVYKTKCAACHGANGEGKMGPKLVGTSLSEAQIEDQLLKGVAGKKAPHAKPIAGLTADQAKAVATYVKGLK